MSEDVSFTRRDDGNVTVNGEWPYEMLVSAEFMRYAHHGFIRSEGFRSFSINVLNGWAKYRAIEKGRYPDTLLCRRVFE